MGFLDDLRKGTGIGLSHSEHYQRAFEKGVLLGPPMYAHAAKLFDDAAKRSAEARDESLKLRAVANARLYAFVATGDRNAVAELATVLPALSEIERVGSRTEVMSAAVLLAEVNARLCEFSLASVAIGDHLARARAHEQAASYFKEIFAYPLVTYRFQHDDPHVDTAQSRFFFNQGMASWSRAMSAVAFDPEAGAEHMGKALSAFRQCNDAKWSGEAEAWLSRCRLRRTCWMCHREFQGAVVHFKTYPAAVTSYTESVVQHLGQDASAIDAKSGTIVLCTACGSALERQAETYATARANAVRAEILPIVHGLAQQVAALTELINSKR